MLEPLALFHRKALRGILSLGKFSTTPALHFLLGELPIEGKIHRDIFSLFYSIWRNPDSKIYSIIRYLLDTTQNNSRTWAAHLRYLCTKYNIPDPLESLKKDPPSKEEFKEYILTKISAFFETDMRDKAKNSSSMRYLNVSLTGLRGKKHPALSGIVTTHEVKKAKIHMKMLAGDYLTYEVRANRSGGSPHCRNCPEKTLKNENLRHILTECNSYRTTRERIFPEFSKACQLTKSKLCFEDILKSDQELTQFILDPASLNLQKRVHMSDPAIDELFRISRDYCYTINTIRMHQHSEQQKSD